MKIANIILGATLVVGSIPAVLVPKAQAADYMCFPTKGGVIFVNEKITSAQSNYLITRPDFTLDQVNTFLLTTSVKNKFPSCLNKSNTFVGFNRVINKNFDYIYTAKYSQIFFTKTNGQELKLYNKRLVITVKFQKIGPALINVTTQYQPPVYNYKAG